MIERLIMHKVCNICGNVFHDSPFIHNKNTLINHCPLANCNGTIYEVDDLLIDLYRKVIHKGYDPGPCCSGHLWDNNVTHSRNPMMFSFNCTTRDTIETIKMTKHFNRILTILKEFEIEIKYECGDVNEDGVVEHYISIRNDASLEADKWMDPEQRLDTIWTFIRFLYRVVKQLKPYFKIITE